MHGPLGKRGACKYEKETLAKFLHEQTVRSFLEKVLFQTTPCSKIKNQQKADNYNSK